MNTSMLYRLTMAAGITVLPAPILWGRSAVRKLNRYRPFVVCLALCAFSCLQPAAHAEKFQQTQSMAADHGEAIGLPLAFIESPTVRSEVENQLKRRWPRGYGISHYCKPRISGIDVSAFSVMTSSERAENSEMTRYTEVVVFGRQDEVVHLHFAEDVEPIRRANCWIDLKSKAGHFLMLKSSDSVTHSSLVHTFTLDGDKTDVLATRGDAELLLLDIDHDGIPELTGYGLGHPKIGSGLSTSPRINLLAQKLNVPGIFPSLTRGIEGAFRIFGLEAKGQWRLIQGGKWASFYRNEAKKIRPIVIRIARTSRDNRVARVGALAVFVGVLEGIGDRNEAERIYMSLPLDVRADIDEAILVAYWVEAQQIEESKTLANGGNHGSK